MIRFIVKARSIADAEYFARLHGLPLGTYRRQLNSAEIALETLSEYETIVARWFCRPDRAPFPVGTCMHYALIEHRELDQ